MVVIIHVAYRNICSCISIRDQQLSVSLLIYKYTIQDLLLSSARVYNELLYSTQVQISEFGKVGI
jgi:hypothetical protein